VTPRACSTGISAAFRDRRRDVSRASSSRSAGEESGDAGWDWGRITAGSIIVAMPVIAFSVPVRRYLVGGLTAGAVKG
jgi:multiple sugar transport system permease protein